MEALVGEINAARPAFSIFLGDTKASGERCTDAVVLDRTASWFGRVEGPLVYTPGDNEWTDCWQDRAGRFDPLERLARLRERFFPEARSLGGAPMPVVRQADRTRRTGSTSRMRAGSARACCSPPSTCRGRTTTGRATASGGAVPPGAAAEYPARNRANLAWIAETFAEAERGGHGAVVFALQSDLYFRDRCGRGTVAGHLDTRAALAEGARRYGRPVLLLHGDSHFYLEDRPVPEAPNLIRAHGARGAGCAGGPGHGGPGRGRAVPVRAHRRGGPAGPPALRLKAGPLCGRRRALCHLTSLLSGAYAARSDKSARLRRWPDGTAAFPPLPAQARTCRLRSAVRGQRAGRAPPAPLRPSWRSCAAFGQIGVGVGRCVRTRGNDRIPVPPARAERSPERAAERRLAACSLTVRGCATFGQMGEARASAGGV